MFCRRVFNRVLLTSSVHLTERFCHAHTYTWPNKQSKGDKRSQLWCNPFERNEAGVQAPGDRFIKALCLLEMERVRKKQFIAPQHELFTCSAPTRPFLLNFDIAKKTLNLIRCQFLPPLSTLSCQITPKMAQRVSQSTSSLQTEECEARSPGGCRGLV